MLGFLLRLGLDEMRPRVVSVLEGPVTREEKRMTGISGHPDSQRYPSTRRSPLQSRQAHFCPDTVRALTVGGCSLSLHGAEGAQLLSDSLTYPDAETQTPPFPSPATHNSPFT